MARYSSNVLFVRLQEIYPKGAPAWLVMHALADKNGDVLLCKRRGLPFRVGW
jgi:hypothetical protein